MWPFVGLPKVNLAYMWLPRINLNLKDKNAQVWLTFVGLPLVGLPLVGVPLVGKHYVIHISGVIFYLTKLWPCKLFVNLHVWLVLVLSNTIVNLEFYIFKISVIEKLSEVTVTVYSLGQFENLKLSWIIN